MASVPLTYLPSQVALLSSAAEAAAASAAAAALLSSSAAAAEAEEPGQDGAAAWMGRALALALFMLLIVLPGALLAHPRDKPEPAWLRLLHPKSKKAVHAQLDDYFAENPNAKAVVLLVLTCFVTAAGTAGLVAVSGQSVYDEVWTTLAGIGLDWTFAGDNRSFLERLVALLVALGGMFITALLVGIVSDSISTKLDELRQGQSPLQESDHVLILGWSDMVLPLVNHVGLARPQGVTIVVLAERGASAHPQPARLLS